MGLETKMVLGLGWSRVRTGFGAAVGIGYRVEVSVGGDLHCLPQIVQNPSRPLFPVTQL